MSSLDLQIMKWRKMSLVPLWESRESVLPLVCVLGGSFQPGSQAARRAGGGGAAETERECDTRYGRIRRDGQGRKRE